MRLTLAVIGMVVLALTVGFLAGYWQAMCGSVPWNCATDVPWPYY